MREDLTVARLVSAALPKSTLQELQIQEVCHKIWLRHLSEILMQSLKFLPWCETAEEVFLLALPQNFMNFVHHEFGSQFSFCSFSPSVHIFPLISLLNKPCFCFPDGLSLTLSLSSNLSGSYQNTALIISPYSLCKLLMPNPAPAWSVLVLLHCQGSFFPGASWPSRLRGPAIN